MKPVDLSAVQFLPVFPLGVTVATNRALQALAEAGESAPAYVQRHATGDWGDVCPDDKAANDYDITHGGLLLSAYNLSTGVRLWVRTEASRRSTTVLLADEE